MWVGTICSIASVVFVIVYKDTAAWIALGTLSVSLLLILIALLRVLNKYLEEDKNGDHRCISSFITYKSEDGNHVSFEMCRFIQVKCAIMQAFDTGFKWTGTNSPEWRSDLQYVENVTKAKNNSDYDKLILRFKNPPIYNQTAVIHYRADIDDSDHKSIPAVDIKVESPTDYVRIIVELGYKSHKNAIAQRKLIHSQSPTEFQTIKEIPNDAAHKQ